MSSFAEALTNWMNTTNDPYKVKKGATKLTLSQVRAGELFGVSARSIRGYQSGEHLPTPAVRLNIMRVAPHLLGQ